MLAYYEYHESVMIYMTTNIYKMEYEVTMIT